MASKRVIAVLGGQWGDEGKGKLVDLLAMDADLVCRAQVSRVGSKSTWFDFGRSFVHFFFCREGTTRVTPWWLIPCRISSTCCRGRLVVAGLLMKCAYADCMARLVFISLFFPPFAFPAVAFINCLSYSLCCHGEIPLFSIECHKSPQDILLHKLLLT